MTDQPILRDRAIDAAKQAINALGMWLPPAGRGAVVDAVLALVSQPAEHCGAVLPGIWEQPPTECVLRPGHQGSHANHDGARWIETAERDHCLDNPQVMAAIGYPVRCPHCATTVPPTHWTKHLQRHHPEVDAFAAAGYCPHCGRGDAGPTADQYEQQRQRAEKAEAALARIRDAVALHRQGLISVHELDAVVGRSAPDA